MYISSPVPLLRIPFHGRRLRTFYSNIFDRQTADRVQDAQDHDADIREDGQPHIGDAKSTQKQAQELDADGKINILL